MSIWKTVCPVDDILPGTGVCALIADRQIALFRPYSDEQIFALSNIDPFFAASVLSRGLIAEHQGELWVASPLKNSVFGYMMVTALRRGSFRSPLTRCGSATIRCRSP